MHGAYSVKQEKIFIYFYMANL
jgi:hypothetical protein